MEGWTSLMMELLTKYAPNKKLERPWASMSLICILPSIQIKDVKKLQQDIENDPIIKDQMAGLGCLF